MFDVLCYNVDRFGYCINGWFGVIRIFNELWVCFLEVRCKKMSVEFSRYVRNRKVNSFVEVLVVWVVDDSIVSVVGSW